MLLKDIEVFQDCLELKVKAEKEIDARVDQEKEGTEHKVILENEEKTDIAIDHIAEKVLDGINVMIGVDKIEIEKIEVKVEIEDIEVMIKKIEIAVVIENIEIAVVIENIEIAVMIKNIEIVAVIAEVTNLIKEVAAMIKKIAVEIVENMMITHKIKIDKEESPVDKDQKIKTKNNSNNNHKNKLIMIYNLKIMTNKIQ